MRAFKAVETLVIPTFGFYYVTMGNTGMLLYTIRCEEICVCLVLAELLHFKLKSRISSAIYAKKLT